MGTPTGNVYFYSGSNQLGFATLANGTAAYPATSLATGTDVVSAQYVGDTNFTYSTSNNLSIRVSPQNVWVANTSGTLSELSNVGSALTSGSGLTGGGAGIAVDHGGFVWSASAAANTLNRFTNTGSASGSFTGGGLNGATALAIDGSGSIWIANTNNTLSLFSNAGVAQSPSAGYTGTGASTPSALVIDATGSVWVANAGNSTITRVLGAADPVVSPTASAVQNATLGAKP
jgi:streptogramin lyase